MKKKLLIENENTNGTSGVTKRNGLLIHTRTRDVCTWENIRIYIVVKSFKKCGISNEDEAINKDTGSSSDS